MKRLRALFEKHRQIILYIAVGFFATMVDSLVYFPMLNLTDVPAPICVALAWASSVTASFLLYKPFVFQSRDWSKHIVSAEFVRFVTTRMGSGILEMLFSLVTVTILGLDGNIMRITGMVVVATLNYITTKYVVFKHRRK